jgi:hypothetical protein
MDLMMQSDSTAVAMAVSADTAAAAAAAATAAATMVVMDPINAPLDILDQTELQSSGGGGEERLVFERLVTSGQLPLSAIPLLTPTTVHTLRPNTLCRYRGLVQNVPNPEIFSRYYCSGSSSSQVSLKYRDLMMDEDDAASNSAIVLSSELSERYALMVI